MAKVVLTMKIGSIYDDLPEKRYHFPRMYLRAMESARGDWAVYYEPLRPVGRRAYFAVARVTDIQPDPNRENLYYAFVDNYLDFDHVVPVRHTTGYYESSLQLPGGELNSGMVQRAVRPIPENEFDLIVRAGFVATVGGDVAKRLSAPNRLAEDLAKFQRPIIEAVVARPFRDEAFRQAVRIAYDSTCAMTGLKIVNGGGRAEAEAAHIRPVADSGPDSVRNGIALCGTVHWMFDRGLVSVSDDYSILVGSKGIPDEMRRLLSNTARLRLPELPSMRPHPQFLEYHRDKVFKS
jgi:putative restriction endonuclease